jgi:hypothetical protein
MAFGDTYELVDVQDLAGQEVLNVYFYRQNNLAVAPTAQDMIDSFVGQVLPSIVATQTNNILHTEIRCRNLFDAADNAVDAISVPGSRAVGDYVSTFNAVGFTLDQDNGAVKNGAKRFAGYHESDTADGVITDAAMIALLTTLSGALTGTLDFGIIATWLPIIVKRLLVYQGVYRLPANQGEQVYGSIVDAIFNPLVTSQVSRKIGVGA